jgi:hypothetical protein
VTAGPAQGRQQQPGQREVAQVVGPELELEALLGQRPRRHHHARVVDQHVDGRGGGRERPYRIQVGEVERPQLDVGGRDLVLDLLERLAALLLVAHGHDHGRALARQLTRG